METKQFTAQQWQNAFEKFEQLFNRWTPNTDPNQYGSTQVDGRYTFIPNYLTTFTHQLSEASKLVKGIGSYPGPSFVDVGCGIGSKLLIASMFGFQPNGVEIVPEYARIAQRAGRIIVGDALRQSYEAFDVVYFYRPFYDGKLEEKLEKHIIKTAKPGAVILANYHDAHAEWWSGKKAKVERLEFGYRKI